MAETEKELLLRVANSMDAYLAADKDAQYVPAEFIFSDDETRTISRVLREAANGGWRDISSAPRDGTRLLLTNGGWVEEGWWSTSMWLGSRGPGWVTDDERECGFTQDDVTHWRPKPTPPPPATETEEPRND